jgi:hypothetical protein
MIDCYLLSQFLNPRCNRAVCHCHPPRVTCPKNQKVGAKPTGQDPVLRASDELYGNDKGEATDWQRVLHRLNIVLVIPESRNRGFAISNFKVDRIQDERFDEESHTQVLFRVCMQTAMFLQVWVNERNMWTMIEKMSTQILSLHIDS